MAQNVEHLEALIGYRLKETQSVLRSRMDEALRPLGLTTPQYACLELLGRSPGASNSELARGAFVTRQTMNTLLRSLQYRNLVERSASPAGGRALPTALTDDGQQLLSSAATLIDAIEEKMVAGLSVQQREDLHELLSQCITSLRE
ncbi:MarR family winged helix-turn-helix transcriptional regulator [Leucobacter chromiireducens]|uniref:MarR family transcriptional regulator n=1 Tax=Leucobacter chromiireducens subsp. solipictus TaxID=398235 RepID=A0ABS1SGB8_9MICO|nr:MarR family transcriptional regulator [Leucobacter chromiireducens]MBL3679505.1 MarR family transcriptional regulator [Leucobacter chromiireducens subsp. solipictus]